MVNGSASFAGQGGASSASSGISGTVARRAATLLPRLRCRGDISDHPHGHRRCRQKAMATRSVTITNAARSRAQRVPVCSRRRPRVPADLRCCSSCCPGEGVGVVTESVRPLADPVYAIAPGSSYVRGDKPVASSRGSSSARWRTLNGKFSGSLTYVAGAARPSGVLRAGSADGLNWMAGPLVVSDMGCNPTPWPEDTFSMVKK